MAAVRIESEAFADRRYERLASEAGLADADHARGKMAVLWRQCTIEQTHVLDECDVIDVLGARGVDALVSSRLGERTANGVRICGTRGRVEWLRKLRENGKHGKKGGRPKKKAQEQENPYGLRGENPDGGPSASADETPLATALALALATATATAKKDHPPSTHASDFETGNDLGQFLRDNRLSKIPLTAETQLAELLPLTRAQVLTALEGLDASGIDRAGCHLNYIRPILAELRDGKHRSQRPPQARADGRNPLQNGPAPISAFTEDRVVDI